MSLIEENFATATKLDENAAVRIQSTIRLLEENTDTRIKLKNPVEGGNTVDFELVNGEMSHVDQACDYNGVNRNDHTLTA
ncbi:hypothetical protein KIH87_06970 [Paraneptunicella aestuarii]|uniref:hypothetical protein n=1 Tax=Paraneptunicella aestuarii TaxID=2831148 RepID=UPI001E378FE7|nr:hypothetical protein [Paraneptunicella aestuarii]UAA40085.1 hypothetical protein KIH87_06970 [Paraneptunicella aestuarii]